ncbi:MAG: tetratricopeptide repeat protein [Bradyrhizobium sp.]|uniref:tetratricopeptide repeat-containing glycosyltransferase family protein n=1 Tax=Bradyrhizobium sp. TaxID=376 RepID=UPI00239AB302|nr:tetratricopeptide repeat protein [Bradyrhizobium sp.]MDE2242441.1 tetratricopeptide repeat protein [Bradyrhizobium sp.]MDE2471340.1 tetratricopeptide repeat protein [Bradyrhizobium sp.]
MNSFQEGDLDTAERLCTDILEFRPENFDALHMLGVLHFQRQHLVEALRFLAAALEVNSSSSDAMSNLGLALHATGRYDEAIASYRNALQLAPDHPEILYNLANAFLELGRFDQALMNYDAVLTKVSNHAGALVNRGNTLLRLNEPEEAIANYDSALVELPGHPQILTNRGHALRRLDRPEQALVDFAAALAAAGEFAEAHFEAAMARLTLGDFARGWKQYEWRWKAAAFVRHRRSFWQPLWLGHEPVAGKTILLHAEQGFGDTIQFVRYAPLLKGQGANVICEIQPELTSLLSQLDDVKVIAKGDALPAFDLHCPLLSLPLAFGTQLGTIPAGAPYLAPRADRLAHWRERLPPDGPRAGFVWSGSPMHKNDANRSIALRQLASLFEDPPLRCLSLQTELRVADRETLRELPKLMHLGDEIRDFADTAAIISLLDVVISVDTAVAHLAGALGKPVVILLPHAADFRWMRQRADTPWYPSAKLLRQPAFGDWASVIHGLRDELRAAGPAASRMSGWH